MYGDLRLARPLLCGARMRKNLAWLVMVGVAACGGGDDDGNSPPDAVPEYDAPSVDANPAACACNATAPTPTRGSAIAISADDSTLVSCNRDVGTVSVARVDYSGSDPALTLVDELDLGVGGEPWQVAIDACGRCAYVVERESQQVTRIEGLDTATPTVGPTVSVGSEPTGIALTPNGTQLYVANWVEGTVSVIDPATMAVSSTVDLNATLVDTGLLGSNLVARPAMAHPRAIAITNDGDTDD